MMKKIMMKVGDNRGMTLMEVIVALMLFVFVFLILGYGINSALKVMGNANAINNATQSNASGLESLGTSLESSQKATLTPLGNTLSINNCALNGKFETATTSKTNDGTSMTLTLFQPAAPSATVPLPTLTAEPTTDKTVVVPSKGTEKENSGNAYYSPDGNNSLLELINYVYSGQLRQISDVFNSYSFYRRTYGDLKKGVIKESINSSYPFYNASNIYLQQLYFINSAPITYTTLDGRLSYCLDFGYLGDVTDQTVQFTKIKMNVNYAYNDTNYTTPLQNSTNSLVFNSYSSGEKVLLFFPKDLEIDCDRYSNWTDKESLSPTFISKGYYLIDSGTDILKGAYNAEALASLKNCKKSFSDVEARLTELGIETK